MFPPYELMEGLLADYARKLSQIGRIILTSPVI